MSDNAIAIPRTVTPIRESVMRHFAYSHLPASIRYFVELLSAAAERIHAELPPGVDRTKALEKLLEARDATIRAVDTQPFQEVGK